MIGKSSKGISLDSHLHMSNEVRHVNNKLSIYGASGLSLRTRTISSTAVPTSLVQSTVSTAKSVRLNNSTLAVTITRPRGRPPRQKNHKHVKKMVQQISSQQVEGDKHCDSTLISESTEASSLKHLQQQQFVNQCVNNYNYDQIYTIENVTNILDTENKKTTPLSSETKNKKINTEDHLCKKNTNGHKRKQSDTLECVAAKRISILNDPKDIIWIEKNLTNNSLQSDKSNLVEYGFLASSDVIEPYRQHRNIHLPSCTSFYYGNTYWPTNWEYSANALTNHVQKKTSKNSLRKIRLVCDGGQNSNAVSLPQKSNLSLKKYNTSFQRRANNDSKSIETNVNSSTSMKRKIGRPKKNKLFQNVLKANSPRKSPRQHASTLANMSNKTLNTDKSEIQDVCTESNKDLLDEDRPFILTVGIPKNEISPGVSHKRLQLNRQNIKRGRRATTSPPPKLYIQKPSTAINSTINHEVVKLRTKYVDVVRKRVQDERLHTAFVCQQLHNVQEMAEQNRHDLAQELIQNMNENKHDYQMSSNAIILPIKNSQDQIWSSQIDNDQEPDNMCLQLMYEQTGDKRFLCTNLSDETLQFYYQQRDLALTERLTNNYYGDNASDLGTDTILASNKRKKKRPNMTGWPKEKRRKMIATATCSMITAEEDMICNKQLGIKRNSVMRRKITNTAKQQRLGRLKLKQQTKKKSKITIPKQSSRNSGPKKNVKITKYHRGTSVSSNETFVCNTKISSKKGKKLKVKKKQRKKHLSDQNNSSTDLSVMNDKPNNNLKRKCGRPKGSFGHQKLMKLQMIQQQSRVKTSTDKQKESPIQSHAGKLKCIVSTRNNRMKLLSTYSLSPNASQCQIKNTTGCKNKKSTINNLSNLCLETLPSSVTTIPKTTRTAKKKLTSAMLRWDAGRPKRYHSTNCTDIVEEDCFIGSQPFEQHCPGAGGGLSHNTVLENHLKENTENDVDLL